MLVPGEVDHEMAELEKENWDYKNNKKSGRYAITFEREFEGGTALWIKAAEYRLDRGRSVVIVVQKFRKKLFGRSSPIGAPMLMEQR